MESEKWVWYQENIALVTNHDIATDFCELVILVKNYKKYKGLTTWSLDERVVLANIHETRPCNEHTILELKENLFVVDDGDEDYIPSSEDEDEDDDAYSAEEEC